MGGQNIFDLISQGISELLNSKLGFLEASGLNLFRGLAIIMIAWYGVKAAVSSAQGGEGFNFAKFADMLLLIAFGFAMLTYYTNPLPGMDHSFSELVTKQASYVSAEIGGNQAESITRAISTAEEQLGSPPGTFSFHEELTYFFVYTLLAVTQGVALAVIAYGFVATAGCVLLGLVQHLPGIADGIEVLRITENEIGLCGGTQCDDMAIAVASRKEVDAVCERVEVNSVQQVFTAHVIEGAIPGCFPGIK